MQIPPTTTFRLGWFDEEHMQLCIGRRAYLLHFFLCILVLLQRIYISTSPSSICYACKSVFDDSSSATTPSSSSTESSACILVIAAKEMINAQVRIRIRTCARE